MANTQYFKLSVSLIDAGGLRTNAVLYGKLDPTQTATALLTEATAQLTLLNAVSDCAIVESFLELGVPLPDQSAFPKNGVNAEKTMLISFADAQTPSRTYGQDTPGVAESILASTDVVDTANTDYIAWRNSFTSAGTHWQLMDPAQAFLTAARRVAITFRKHRRGQSRVSGESGA